MTARRLPVIIDIDAPGCERPVTRGDCVDGCRPCGWLTCKAHLGVEITNVGHMRLHPLLRDLGVVKGLLAMKETCLYDAVENGKQHDQEETAELLGINQSNVSRAETSGLSKARTHVAGGH